MVRSWKPDSQWNGWMRANDMWLSWILASEWSKTWLLEEARSIHWKCFIPESVAECRIVLMKSSQINTKVKFWPTHPKTDSKEFFQRALWFFWKKSIWISLARYRFIIGLALSRPNIVFFQGDGQKLNGLFKNSRLDDFSAFHPFKNSRVITNMKKYWNIGRIFQILDCEA